MPCCLQIKLKGHNKVYVPEQRTTVIVSASEYDYRTYDTADKEDLLAAQRVDYGTDFIIDVSHSDIYFNASFGAVGYNDLTITQANGNTATIYDKLGNVLFDGTNDGDGKWRLQCIIDLTSTGRHQGVSPYRIVYDGTNETWEITKLE